MARNRKTEKPQPREKTAASKGHAGISTMATLPPAKRKTLAILLAKRTAKSVRDAFALMQSHDASDQDWTSQFTGTVLCRLVETWSPEVWEQVTAALHTHPTLLRTFKALLRKRFAKLDRTKQSAVQAAALTNLTPMLSTIVAGLMPATNASLDLDGLTRLTQAGAHLLGRFRGDVSLGGLTNLSDAEAELLSRFKGKPKLYGLTELGSSRGHLLLAKKLSRSRDLQLPCVKRLSDRAAKLLSRQRGMLYLDGMTTISDAAAQSLSTHRGGLSLDGLTTLTDSAAQSLGRSRGALSLCGLSSLSDTTARALSMNRGWLRLDSVRSLSPTAALHLSKHRGDTLELGALTSLSDAAAESLSHFKGQYLRLASLTVASDAALKSLSLLLKGRHERLQVAPALRERIWLAGNRIEQPLNVKDLQRRKKDIVSSRTVDLKEYSAITDEAAQLLASFDLCWCDLSNLATASDQALKYLATIEGLQLSPAIKSRTAATLRAMQQLQRLGYMKFADSEIPDWRSLSLGGQGLGAAYQVTDQAGVSYSVGRLFGADAEDLVEEGVRWFFDYDLSHFGVDATGVDEVLNANVHEWRYRGTSYAISGKGIGDSAYERAAFALVAILNRKLKANGSGERAFGINEGNAFGVAFLTEPLKKVFERLTNEQESPKSEKDLALRARASIRPGEPPLVRVQG